MNELQWKQDNETAWSLYKDGDDFVGYIYYEDFVWRGSFRTSDGRAMGLEFVADTLLKAKEKILGNYLMDRSYEWWMR